MALLPGGSLNGLKRLAAGEAVVAAVHLLDEGGEYNVGSAFQRLTAGSDVVAIQWAWREQGLVVAPDNPIGIKSLWDLAKRKARLDRKSTRLNSSH